MCVDCVLVFFVCLLASCWLTHSMQLYPVTTYKCTIVGLIVCAQYFSSLLCGRISVKFNIILTDVCYVAKKKCLTGVRQPV